MMRGVIGRIRSLSNPLPTNHSRSLEFGKSRACTLYISSFHPCLALSERPLSFSLCHLSTIMYLHRPPPPFLSQTIHLMIYLPAKLSNRLRTRMFPQNTSLLAGIAYSSSLSRLSILASRVLHFFLVRTLVFIDRHRSRKIPASVVSRFSRVCHSYQTMS